jgi:hypothetical protein
MFCFKCYHRLISGCRLISTLPGGLDGASTVLLAL